MHCENTIITCETECINDINAVQIDLRNFTERSFHEFNMS